jgi:hypothetical protein
MEQGEQLFPPSSEMGRDPLALVVMLNRLCGCAAVLILPSFVCLLPASSFEMLLWRYNHSRVCVRACVRARAHRTSAPFVIIVSKTIMMIVQTLVVFSVLKTLNTGGSV